MKVYEELAKEYNCEFDERGNIGKRYRDRMRLEHLTV